MHGSLVTNVQRQVRKANRRLFVQMLLNHLVWFWALALLLAAMWFLIQPLLIGSAEDWVRWAIAGAVFAAATAFAVWRTWRHAPSHVEAALELDKRFKLKERTTTSLTLAPELQLTPAGQALMADADSHVAKVNVRQGFPVRLSWAAMLVPVCAVVLTLVAIFYNPVFRSSELDAATEANKVANAKGIVEKLDKLKEFRNQPWPKEEKNEKLQEIEKLTDKILQQPLDPNDKDKLRERLQEMVRLEDKLKNRLDDLKAQEKRNKALQDKLKEMGQDPEGQLNKEGPADGLEDALNKGDLDKAQKEIQELADNLQNNKLTDTERELLQKQLDDIQRKLVNLADLKDLKDQFQKDLETLKITKEQFDKLMAKAAEDAEKLKDLKDLGKRLLECKECVGGDPKDAAGKLAGIAKDLKDLDANAQEARMLAEQQQLLLALKGQMRNGLGGGPPGDARPMAEDVKTGLKDSRQSGQLDAKAGALRISGEQKGGTFSKIPANQVGGAFQQAQQDAPNAIDRQQVPADAAEMIRGFYENMNGGKKK